jgi:hypothetical protein
MQTYWRRLAAVVTWMVLVSTPVLAQPASGTPARELAALLDARHLESIAARLPDSPDTFVAALYMPGQQLILVSGRYEAPSLLREKIILGKYRDAYLDLYSAGDRASRVVVEDLRADGLRPVPQKNEPFDVVTQPGTAALPLDGDWKRRKLSREDYMDAFERADASYATLAGVLVAALKRSNAP